ncbi:hypothetical protein [Pseudodesulfovibrio sp. zrk46]|uniref:hypothetical protein n=1 Tax=Pseudodesulfovibrio sp. zrk46 TaxID=2725288 RepID=UPI001449BFF5|nr:hypothetical protein [Pseudodesulfovibrio sp. zrk46]QJB55631.1 hypothetical protein HFN16_04120 [Pseudodesulfovibrio sp. zrk46]
MARRGSSEFINLTLTEFLMVIIFILITLLFYTFQKYLPENHDSTLTPKESELVEGNATLFAETLFHVDTADNATEKPIFQFIDEMEKLLADPDVRQGFETTPLPEIWDTLEAMEEEEAYLRKTIDTLKQAIKDAKGETLEQLVREKTRLTKKLGTVTKELKKYEPLHAELGTKTPAAALRKVRDREGQMADLAERARKQGIGSPLCWSTKDMPKEYLFSIDIMENGMFRVTPIQPEHRNEALRELGYPFANKTVYLTMQGFKEQMQRFWDYGMRDNNCRFMVKVRDLTTTKERWKQGLGLVENYFYKLEVP